MALPTSVNTVYAPGVEVESADLNAIQQCIVGAKHGDVTATMSALEWKPSVAGFHTYNFAPIRISSTGSITFFMTLPLRVGDRLKTVNVAVLGTGAINVQFDVYKTSAAIPPVDANIGTVGPAAAAATWVDQLINVTDTTLAAGESFSLVVTVSGTGVSVGNAKALFDRP